MFTLTDVSLVLDFNVSSTAELESYCWNAYNVADHCKGSIRDVQDLGVSAVAARGSVETIAVVGATVAAVLAAISNYSSFLEGLSKLMEHARAAGQLLRSNLTSSKEIGEARIVRTSVTCGHLELLDNLHRLVNSGRIPPHEAADSAV